LQTTRVDRLSLLPNELLGKIFEYAYSTAPPTAPLSKHLFPFFEEHLYRRVSLYSSRQVALFLESLFHRRDRGKLVKSLELDRDSPEVVKSLDILESLFPLLPNVVHLEINAECIEMGLRSKNIFRKLPKVQSVTTTPWSDENDYLDLHQFAFLATLPSLSTLDVVDWPVIYRSSLNEEEEDFRLLRVQTLRIEGMGAEQQYIRGLVELCPALTSVELDGTWSQFSYSDALDTLPSTIQSLRLGSEYVTVEPSDQHLLRFAHLRSLDLGEGCYSNDIHSVLSELPSLVKLRLGRGAISPDDFKPLISGRTRLVNLNCIRLDFEVGVVGKRMSLVELEESDDAEEMNDWRLSHDIRSGQLGRGVGEDSYVTELKKLMTVAEANGVRIEGSVHEALALVESYWIEANNRAVIGVYSRNDSLERLDFVQMQAYHNGVSIPDIDFDSLDYSRLELVKIDLPGRNWYILGLRNVARSNLEASYRDLLNEQGYGWGKVELLN
jgi:hypothetical protein